MTEAGTYLPGIFLSLSAMMLALMSPGPNILAVIGTSMNSGRRCGLVLALGVTTGTFLSASVAVLGLTALLTAYAGMLTFIKIAGGCYLLYLGYKSLRSAASHKDLTVSGVGSPVRSLWRYFGRGLTVQLTNPKAALAMTAIITLGVQGSTPAWVNLVLVFGVTTLSIVGHLAYAFAFSIKLVVAIYIKARRWIEGTLGVFFCCAGIRLIFEKN